MFWLNQYFINKWNMAELGDTAWTVQKCLVYTIKQHET